MRARVARAFALLLLLAPAAVSAAELPNTAPAVSPIPDQSVAEDSARRVAFTVRDAETPAGALAVFASSSDTTLLPRTGLRLGGSGASRYLTVRPAANRYGSVRVSVRVSDGELSGRVSFLLRVRPVNDPPVFRGAPPAAATADSLYEYLVTTSDPDPGDPRTITAVYKPAWLTLAATGRGTATLKGRPTTANLGLNPVRLKVADAAGAATFQTFAVRVVRAVVSAPVVEPGGGVFASPVTVTLACATPGAAIRYTTDGTTPSETSGTLYAAPFEVSRAMTLTAAAFKPGMDPSAPAAASFSFLPGVETRALTSVGTGDAAIRGAVNPRGLPTTAWFEWGTDPGLADAVRTDLVAAGDGVGTLPLSFRLTNLDNPTTYYYRLVAENAAGTAQGRIEYFAPWPADLLSIVVNSPDDPQVPVPGKMTIRAAIELLGDGGAVTFAPRLDGATIGLTIVGEPNSTLKGEVFTMNAGKWEFLGYQERNYGRSALYAAKSLTIDASSLPGGVTLAWAGGESSHARVLAVYGNLTLRKVNLASGWAAGELIPGSVLQPYTLARGGGLATWGRAVLEGCTISGNRVTGDTTPSRDRGAFGGGVYANTLLMSDCVVSGNAVRGYGGAGGGVYSVSGADTGEPSLIERSTVSGNRVTAEHAYGGGVFTEGGGPGNGMTLDILSCTIARNRVEDDPALAESQMTQYYYRGGGVYMSNGYLNVGGSTIVENEVTGVPGVFGGKPNMGGGGIAATVGDAHVVESMTLWQSIVAGNTLGGVANDVFPGSVIDFYSYGYNRVGALDVSQMLVPVPSWYCLSRRHWPKAGDRDGVVLAEVLDLAGARLHDSVVSVGTDDGGKAVLWYPPQGDALDQVPAAPYPVVAVWAQYQVLSVPPVDDFPSLLLEKLRTDYADVLGSDFGLGIDPAAAVWYEEGYTWPSDPRNAPWIAFWRSVDAEIGTRLGAAGLADGFWGGFASGMFGANVQMDVTTSGATVYRCDPDQLGTPRTEVPLGDIGAVEGSP